MLESVEGWQVSGIAATTRDLRLRAASGPVSHDGLYAVAERLLFRTSELRHRVAVTPRLRTREWASSLASAGFDTR